MFNILIFHNQMNHAIYLMSLTSSRLEEFDNVEKEADLPVPTNLATACPRDKDVSMLFLPDRFTQSPKNRISFLSK